MAHNWPPVSLDDSYDTTRRLLFFLLRHGFGGSNGLRLLAHHVIVLLIFI
jgi:hypothetical protein